MLLEALAVSIAGGLISVDRTAAFQMMISRPLVAASITGVMLGNPAVGLVTGVIIELLFIGDLPVGRYVPVNDTSVAIVSTAVGASALAGARGIPDAIALAPAALVLVMPFGFIYHRADVFARRRNERFFDAALKRIEAGEMPGLMRENLSGSGLFFLTSAAAIFSTALPLMYLASYAPTTLGGRGWAFYAAFGVCMALGAASALNAVHTQRSLTVYAASMACSAAIWFVI